MPSSFAHAMSSLVVMHRSMSRREGSFQKAAELFISSLRISNFFAVQGVRQTLTIFLGSMPRFLAYQVLIVGPCMPMGLFADERCGRSSG